MNIAPTNTRATLQKDIRHHAGWCKDAHIAGYDKCPHEAWLPEREAQLNAIITAVDQYVQYVMGPDLDDFAITIQFTVKDGSTDMTLTTNDAESPDTTNMRIHGIHLSENTKQLDMADHEALQAFCKSYLEHSGYVVR